MQIQKQNKTKQGRPRTEQKTVQTLYCQPEAPVSWLQTIITALSLCALTVAAYLPSLHYPFQFDDLQSITHHFSIRHSTLADLFMANRRWISYWLNSLYFSWDRFNPFIYRVGNLSFHLVTGLLIFAVLLAALRKSQQLFLSRNALTIATITTGLFLLYPTQTQTVSYVIQGQLEGLATLASMLVLALFFCCATIQNALVKTMVLILMLGTAAIASCTKEIFVVTPIIVMLFDWFFIAQGSWQQFKKRLVAHGLLTLTVFGMFAYFADPAFFKKLVGFTHSAQNGAGSLVTESYTQNITSWPYIISQFKVLFQYLWIFIWPFGLCVDRDTTIIRDFFCGDVLVPLLGLVALGYFLIRRIARNPTDPLTFGVLWFFIFITPRSLIPSAELMNDYKTYGASIGIFFLLACGLAFLIQKCFPLSPSLIRPRGWFWAPLLLILPLCFCTAQRNRVWASEKAFWGDIIEKSPRKTRALNSYGAALAKENDHKRAIYYFQKAIALDPSYMPPYNNMAISYQAVHDVEAALKIMKMLTTLQPNNPEVHSNFGSFLIDLKRLDEAEPYLKRALELRPHYGKASFHLGRLYFEKGDPQAAYQMLKRACTQGDFDTAQGFYAYGKACLLTDRLDEAEQTYQKAYALFPDYYDICFEYASVLCLHSKFKEAQQLYKRAYALKPGDANLLFNLGEAYWGDQQYTEALAWYKKAAEQKVKNPALSMRLAGCHDKLGDRKSACAILEEFLKQKPPADLKKAAEGALATMRSQPDLGEKAF